MTPAWNANYHVNAVMDDAKEYRYLFECNWSAGERFVTFILLNPSVGNVTQTDPTLARCMYYAKLWGYDGFKVVNLYAFIATDPDRLLDTVDPVGPENDRYIRLAAEQSETVVLAWGSSITSEDAKKRMEATIELVRHKRPQCLKMTVDGNYPRHPLYLPKNVQPVPYRSKQVGHQV